MRISDWSSDVCSSDLRGLQLGGGHRREIVRPDRRPADPRRIGRRLTPLDRIDITHAVDHAPDRGVFAVKFPHRLKPDDELAVRRKRTRLNSRTNAHLACSLLLATKKANTSRDCSTTEQI